MGRRINIASRMFQVPPILVGVTLVLAMACRGGGRRHAVIAYAVPGHGNGVIQVVRDEIARNPVPGIDIEVVYDSTVPGDSPEIEVHRAERLSEIPGLVAVVGHGGSRGSLAAAPVYNTARIPQIVPTSTSRLLHDVGPWTFVLAPNDSVEGALLARFAVQALHAQRISMLYLNDEYGVGLRDGALLELEQMGQRLIDQVPLGNVNDLPTLIDASFTRGVPDLLLVAARDEPTGEIARIAAARNPAVRVVAGDGALVMPDLMRSAGPAGDSIYVAAFWTPDSASERDRAYVAQYRAIAGIDPLASSTMTRDALMLVVQAIREVGTDRRAVREWLERLGRGHPPFEGITGAITFRDEARPRLRIVRLQGNSLVPVRFP
jgi:branched-chain amino acid transport system substrate-binding protein